MTSLPSLSLFAALRPLLFALVALAASVAARAADAPRNILFFGDSLTVGYGVDPDEAYPALVQEKITAAGLDCHVINAGLSGDTTAGGLRRLDWVIRRVPVDVFVLALGANDGLRGVPVDETRANLVAIIAKMRAKNPEVRVVLAGMQMPANMGEAYTRAYREMFPAVAEETEATLIPFLLDGVGDVPEMNQADHIHPNPAGHRLISDTVWKVLRSLL